MDVAGTDAGSCGTRHPALVEELLLMHDYGMATDAVLRAATTTAGRVLGRAGPVGAVQPGSAADCSYWMAFRRTTWCGFELHGPSSVPVRRCDAGPRHGRRCRAGAPTAGRRSQRGWRRL